MHDLSLSFFICLDTEIETAEPRSSWGDYYVALLEHRERNRVPFLLLSIEILY